MKIHISAISDIGLIRTRNEDNILVYGSIFTNKQVRQELNVSDKCVLAVADGMGGHRGGDIASFMVLENLKEFCAELRSGFSFSELTEIFDQWVVEAKNQLYTVGNQRPELKGMGTTLSGVYFYYDTTLWFNSGDSRVYLFREGTLLQLTTDHTLARLDANNNLQRSHILTNSIGGGDTAYLDMGDLTGFFNESDILMICSDGLSDMVSDDTLERYLKNFDSKGLVEQAKLNGGKDNISLIMIRKTNP